MSGLVVAGIAGAVLVVLFVLFKLMWRVAEPNEALIISGLRQHSPAGQCADGHGRDRIAFRRDRRQIDGNFADVHRLVVEEKELRDLGICARCSWQRADPRFDPLVADDEIDGDARGRLIVGTGPTHQEIVCGRRDDPSRNRGRDQEEPDDDERQKYRGQ